MRSSKNRSRNKQNRNRPTGNIVNRVFDSSGPEGKVRGTPQQIIDKYTQLARDAQLGNDRVAAENFQQHAEHYTRMLGEAMREQEARREAQEAQQQNQNQNQNRGRQRDRDFGPDSDDQPNFEGGNNGSSERGGPDIVDVPEGRDSGLVETPEMKADKPAEVDAPKPARRPRRPRTPKAENPGSDTPGSSETAAG